MTSEGPYQQSDWHARWGVGPGPGGGTGVLLEKMQHWPNPVFDAVHAADFYDVFPPPPIQFPRPEMTNAYRAALETARDMMQRWLESNPETPFLLFDPGPDYSDVQEVFQDFLDHYDPRTPPMPEPPDQSAQLEPIIKAASNPFGYYREVPYDNDRDL